MVTCCTDCAKAVVVKNAVRTARGKIFIGIIMIRAATDGCDKDAGDKKQPNLDATKQGGRPKDDQGATRGPRGLIGGRGALKGEWGAVEDATAEGDGVGIFNLIAYADTEGEGGDLEMGKTLKLAEDISVGEIAFHSGGKGENHLVDGRLTFTLALADSLNETVNLELSLMQF